MLHQYLNGVHLRLRQHCARTNYNFSHITDLLLIYCFYIQCTITKNTILWFDGSRPPFHTASFGMTHKCVSLRHIGYPQCSHGLGVSGFLVVMLPICGTSFPLFTNIGRRCFTGTWTVVIWDHFLYLFTTKDDDVIKWKHFPRYWTSVMEIHRSLVNFLHKGL